MCACVRACMHACVRVRACACVSLRGLFDPELKFAKAATLSGDGGGGNFLVYENELYTHVGRLNPFQIVPFERFFFFSY